MRSREVSDGPLGKGATEWKCQGRNSWHNNQDRLSGLFKYAFKSTYSLAETRFTVYFCSCQSPLSKALALDMDSVLQKVDWSLWSAHRLMWRVTWKYRFPLTTNVFRYARIPELFRISSVPVDKALYFITKGVYVIRKPISFVALLGYVRRWNVTFTNNW